MEVILCVEERNDELMRSKSGSRAKVYTAAGKEGHQIMMIDGIEG